MKTFQMIITGIFKVSICYLFIVLLFLDKRITYYCQNTSVIIPNVLIVLALFLGFVLIKKYKGRFEWKNKITDFCNRYWGSFLIIGTFVVVVMQVIIIRQIFFRTGWDAESVTTIAEQWAQGGSIDSGYLVTSPNNKSLTFVLAIIYKISEILHLSNGYVVSVYANIIFLNVSAICIYFTTRIMLRNHSWSLIAWVLFQLLIGVSPWVMIPYSDTYAMPFVAIICLLYVFKPDSIKKNICRWLLILLFGFFGMSLKPTVSIVLIAIILIEGFKWISNKQRAYKPLLMILVMAAVLQLGMGLWNRLANEQLQVKADDSKELLITHFLMMGSNTVTNGGYHWDDVAFTLGLPSREEKISQNILVTKERYKEMGVKGYIEFFNKKLLSNYNDGTFSWGREGNFFKEYNSEDESAIGQDFRSYYYTDGSWYPIYATLKQIIWIMVLFFIALNLFPSKNISAEKELMLYLIILGITSFQQIFECRGRYLICFLPVFIVCAVIGLFKGYGRINMKSLE